MLHRQSQALNLLSPALQASAWCHLSKSPLLSLLDHFYIYSLMVEKKDAITVSVPASYVTLPPQTMQHSVRTDELAGREERGAKQLYGSTAQQQEPKQIGRKECCCSMTYFPSQRGT